MTDYQTWFGNEFPLVETDWLETNIDAPDLRILDCTVLMSPDPSGGTIAVSGQTQWEAEHIPGSGFADVLGALSDQETELRFTLPGADRFAEAMGVLGVDEGTRVVLYSSEGYGFAARVWWMLREFGFCKAAILNGGLTKWKNENRPLTDDLSPIAPTTFIVRERSGDFVDKAHMIAALEDSGACIINALTNEQHAGSGGSNYGRPGRIPGTCCIPSGDLVNQSTGTYKPMAELRCKFAEVGVFEADRVITYCGGGIAASSDAFVLSMLGVNNISIYDGSLREWVADLDLPMETD